MGPDLFENLQDLAVADQPWRRDKPGGPGDASKSPLSSLALRLAHHFGPIIPITLEFLLTYHVHILIMWMEYNK